MKAVAAFSRVNRRLIVPLLLLLTLVPALVLFFHSTDAESAFPGNNGKIVFVKNYDIYVMNADGSGATNLTNSPGFTDDSPAFSPDGTKIVYTSTATGGVDILSMNADGSNVTQLTNDANWDAHPAWSPDGTKIVFQSDRAGGGNWEIYTIDANGANLTRLTNVAGNDSEPAWSPDGTKIAFTSYRDGNAEIYRMDANGANQFNITNNSSKDESPVWSPDGTMIAFDSRRAFNNEEIFRMAADGTGVTQVTFAEFSPETLPAWSSDGTKITFVSGSDTSAEIYSISTPGNDQSPWARLTNDGAQDSHPDWQPALAPAGALSPPGVNGKIVFDSTQDGNWEIYTMNPDGTGETRLTNNSAADATPVWSPDGRRIAFTSSRDGFDEIYVMDADGSNQTRLTSNGSNDSAPGWSPDGSSITFSSDRDGNWEIYAMNADGSGQTRLTASPGEDSNPAWSRDGTRITFTSDRHGGLPQIYVMNANGSVQTRLTNNAGWDQNPAWSSDGSKIFFNSIRGGNIAIYSMNADGSSETQLTPPWSDYTPASSPDGTQITYSGRPDYGVFGIYVMNADGSGRTRIKVTDGSVSSPDWQPVLTPAGQPLASAIDGKIAVESSQAIDSMNADGTGRARLTNSANTDREPAWSPDGTKIAFVSYRDGNGEIYSANADGTVQTRLTNDSNWDGEPAWSPDGTKIAFTSNRDGNTEVYSMNANGSNQTRVTLNAGSHNSPSWSPDGSKIAYSGNAAGNSEIYYVNADGTGMIRLTNDSATDYEPAWSPDGNRIAFTSDHSGNAEIYVMNTNGSVPTRITTNTAHDSLPAWSPNGSKIAFFSTRSGYDDVWVMNADGSSPANITNSKGEEYTQPAWQPQTRIDYFWTWYDSTGSLRNWVLMANPAGSGKVFDFDLSVAGTPKDLSPFAFPGNQPGEVPEGMTLTPSFNGLIGGPVKATSKSPDRAVVSQRSLMGNSLEEVLGTEAGKLSSHFVWSWYDQQTPGYLNWVLIANPSATETVLAQIRLAGSPLQNLIDPGRSDYGQYYFEIAPGQNVTPNFPGAMGGPLEVRAYRAGGNSNELSDRRDVIASQRVLSGNGSAFNEVPGIPASELSNSYQWTWYDQQTPGFLDWILVASPASLNSGGVTFEIRIGGNLVPCHGTGPGQSDPATSCTLLPGDILTPAFPGEMNGPVEVTSQGGNVIASQRVIAGPSFEEVPGYRTAAFASDYHWTWYDSQSAGAQNWILVSNPGSGEVTYQIKIGGRPMLPTSANPGTIGPGGKVTPMFPGEMDGPVEVVSSGGNVMVSQRVLWNGYFNEVLGTVLN